ncbi:MAG: O-antigen ligase family protein [Chlamydiia bacterium]|nr:O-antigen ligase family protein [Chlamydiia bacterium]
MANSVVLLVGVCAFLFCWATSIKRSFFALYLPLLLLIPPEFTSSITGLPDFTPSQICLLALFGFFVVHHLPRWKFSVLDVIVLTYASLSITSEGYNSAYDYPLKEINNQLVRVLLPYMFAKELIGHAGNWPPFAKRLIWIVFMITLLAPWEVRMSDNPFYNFFSHFFHFTELPFMFRGGWVRYYGPFTHPILAGVICSLCLILNYWLIRNKLWGKFRYLPWMMNAFLFFSLVMSSSRAPLFTFFFGIVLAGIGYSAHRFRTIFIRLGLLALVCVSIYIVILPYLSVNPALAKSRAATTLLYRIQLIDTYWDIIVEKPLLGWGDGEWPKMGGMPSIDNHYLWIILRHGFLTLTTFLLMYVMILPRLLWHGLRKKALDQSTRTLHFALFAIFSTQMIVFYTVFMGGQTETLFFLFLGGTEGLLVQRQQALTFSQQPVLP